MDKSQQLGFNSLAHTLPQPNPNTPVRELLPMISHVMPAQEQTIRAEEFRGYIIGMYDQNQQTYLNLILNIVAHNGGNNTAYTEALTNYLNYCTSLKASFNQLYGRDGNVHLLLAKAAIYRTVDAKAQFRFWLQNMQNDVNLINWINNENASIRNNQVMAQVTEITKQALAKRQSAMGGIGFGTGMGQTNTQQQMSNSNVMMSPSVTNQASGMLQVTPTQTQPSSGSLQITPAQPQQTQVTPNNMTTEPVKAKPITRREGHRLFCDVNSADFDALRNGQYGVLGGWAINPEAKYFQDEDYTKFDKFRWVSKYGVFTNATRFIPRTYESYDKLLDELDDLETNEQNDLFIEEPELDPEDPNSNGYLEYLNLIEAQAKRRRERSMDAAFGIFMGVQDVLTVGTNPWALPVSIYAAAETIFGEDVLDLIQDSVHVATINNREYLLIDSSDYFANGIVRSKRELYKHSWVKRDNVSAEGHYYIINHYVEDFDGKPVIEDFYDMETYMNPDKYQIVEPGTTFQMDSDDGAEGITDVTTKPQLRLRESGLTMVTGNPVELAEAMRTDASLTRAGEWSHSILEGKFKQPSFLLTVGKKDVAIFDQLQKDIKDQTIQTIRGLGDWLIAKKEAKELTLRMERVLDSRITKELNVIFNDMLGFTGLIIEHSFMGEYAELLDMLKDESTPAMVEAQLKRAEYLLIQRALLEVNLNDTRNKQLKDYYIATSPYTFKNEKGVNTMVLNSDHSIPVDKSLHAFCDTVRVYALPMTIDELGLNPHGELTTMPWTNLPEELLNEVKKNFIGAFNMEKVVLVTKDNYSLTVNGTRDESIAGSISILV